MKYGPLNKPLCYNTFYGGDLVVTYFNHGIYYSDKRSLL